MAPRQPLPRRTARRKARADGSTTSDQAQRDQRAARRSAKPKANEATKPQSSRTHRSPRKVLSTTKASTPHKATPRNTVHHKLLIESDGTIPPWASLPYEVLLQVFRYAAYPLHDETFRASSSVNWLVQTARLCKSFSEPALAALYESPPLFTLDKPHRLLELLCDKRHKHSIDYRTKIKRLELDSVRVLAYKTPGRGTFDLSDLIPLLPRLSAIDITNPRNRQPFRRFTDGGKWHYTNDLFSSLQDVGIRLKSWRWHGDMLSDRIATLENIHKASPFNHLRHLTLSNMELLANGASRPRRWKAAISSEALVPLTQLSVLVLESCTSTTWDLLDHLPGNIQEFTVVNCPEFGTKDLDEFLSKHGKTLRQLTLKHNQSLDLTFLPGLATSCPQLEVLEIDLTYFSASILGDLTHQSDSDPRYDILLHPGDIPSWPSQLRALKLLHLRKLSSAAAETLFNSLIEAAPRLSFLRILIIKAMLDISWRERAGFREQWINKLEKAFLRRSKAPDLNLGSNKMFRLWKENSRDRAIRQQAGSSNSKPNSGDEDSAPCETVDISIDNMRPSELRFTENDFMDSEESGDEDWNRSRGD